MQTLAIGAPREFADHSTQSQVHDWKPNVCVPDKLAILKESKTAVDFDPKVVAKLHTPIATANLQSHQNGVCASAPAKT